MRTSRSLEYLHPVVRDKCKKFLWWCRVFHMFGGIKKVFLVCTYRDREKQAQLYSRGRDETGKIIDRAKVVTWAQPGQSLHNNEDTEGNPASQAFDIAFRPWLDKKGVTWNGNWWLIGKIAQRCGLQWGGTWAPPKTDRPHLQWTDSTKKEV